MNESIVRTATEELKARVLGPAEEYVGDDRSAWIEWVVRKFACEFFADVIADALGERKMAFTKLWMKDPKAAGRLAAKVLKINCPGAGTSDCPCRWAASKDLGIVIDKECGGVVEVKVSNDDCPGVLAIRTARALKPYLKGD